MYVRERADRNLVVQGFSEFFVYTFEYPRHSEKKKCDQKMPYFHESKRTQPTGHRFRDFNEFSGDMLKKKLIFLTKSSIENYLLKLSSTFISFSISILNLSLSQHSIASSYVLNASSLVSKEVNICAFCLKNADLYFSSS